MNKQQEEVVKPLIKQAVGYQKENHELKDKIKLLKDNMKKLQSLLRTPRLTDLYQK